MQISKMQFFNTDEQILGPSLHDSQYASNCTSKNLTQANRLKHQPFSNSTPENLIEITSKNLIQILAVVGLIYFQ